MALLTENIERVLSQGGNVNDLIRDMTVDNFASVIGAGDSLEDDELKRHRHGFSEELAALIFFIMSARLSRQRLSEARRKVHELYAGYYGETEERLLDSLADLAVVAAAAELSVYTGIGLRAKSPIERIVRSRALSRKWDGGSASQWARRLRRRDFDRTWRIIVSGALEGAPSDHVVRSVIGTRSLRFKDGAAEVSRRGLATFIRTALSHVNSVGREETWKANGDFIRYGRWTSVLDTKTSAICRHRDGRVAPAYEGAPFDPPSGAKLLRPPFARPPAHPNCRSVFVAVMREFADLLFEEDLPADVRRAFNGRGPSDITYYQWLRRQPDSRQREVLGKTRYSLWKTRGERPEKFHSRDGKWLTIAQLRRKFNLTE